MGRRPVVVTGNPCRATMPGAEPGGPPGHRSTLDCWRTRSSSRWFRRPPRTRRPPDGDSRLSGSFTFGTARPAIPVGERARRPQVEEFSLYVPENDLPRAPGVSLPRAPRGAVVATRGPLPHARFRGIARQAGHSAPSAEHAASSASGRPRRGFFFARPGAHPRAIIQHPASHRLNSSIRYTWEIWEIRYLLMRAGKWRLGSA